MNNNETFAEAIVAVRKMIHDCPAIKGGLGELRYQLKANGAINIIEEAHDREIKALEWKIENYAKVVECKDREIKAKEAKIEELRDCLRIIRDNLLSYTIKSEDGNYVNNGGFLSEEFVDDERWRKALEGGNNEVE